MEYRFLGPTGLRVSALSFGNMSQFDLKLQKEYDLITQKCWESGINFFDTAEGYHQGNSEIILGESIKNLKVPREEIVVSTKVFLGTGPFRTVGKPNTQGLSRKHVIEGVTGSLKRLQLEYADVIFCHRFDHETPVEETCRAMNWLIDNGKAFYWGTSEWTAQQIQDAYTVCDRLDLQRPIVEQCQYNMLNREKMESDYVPIFNKFKMGTTVWSPLAGGILSGKYQDSIPEDSRAGQSEFGKKIFYDPYMGEGKKEKTVATLKALGEIAKELNATLPQLAYAWVLANQDVSSAIIGATKIEQVEDNLKAVALYKNLTPETLKKIEDVLGNRPNPGMNWKTFTPAAPRR